MKLAGESVFGSGTLQNNFINRFGVSEVEMEISITKAIV